MKNKPNNNKNRKNKISPKNNKVTCHKPVQSAAEIASIISKMVILIIGKLSRIKLNGVEKSVSILRINKQKKFKNCMLNVNKIFKKIFCGMDTRLVLLDR